MRRLLLVSIAALFPACSATPGLPSDLVRHLAEAPEGTACRLIIDGGRLVGAAVPIGRAMVPPAVRTAIDAVAPEGELVFRGREWGARGEGYRIEKRYLVEAAGHVRSALIARDGRVLERAHSVPLGDVPEAVLTAALAGGLRVEQVMIVSGPRREEHWCCTAGDRIGRVFVATVGLDGSLRSVARRVDARVDAPAPANRGIK